MRPILRIARHPASGLVLLAGLAVTWPLAHLVGCMSTPREASAGELVATVAVPAATSSGSAGPAVPKAAPDAPRLYAKTRFVWVKPEPGAEGWIGFLWTGGSVKLRKEAPRSAAGCATKWYPIEPRGWVCAAPRRRSIHLNRRPMSSILKTTIRRHWMNRPRPTRTTPMTSRWT